MKILLLVFGVSSFFSYVASAQADPKHARKAESLADSAKVFYSEMKY